MKPWINEPEFFSFHHIGFVYIITNSINKRFYIGQKKFWQRRKSKSKKKKGSKYYFVESNWKKYFGSCKELLADVEKYGSDSFTRKILYICKSKAEMNYQEAKLQFYHRVLHSDLSYNRIINCRISQNQVTFK